MNGMPCAGALQGVVGRWDAHTLMQQREVFNAALAMCDLDKWGDLELNLLAALSLAA